MRTPTAVVGSGAATRCEVLSPSVIPLTRRRTSGDPILSTPPDINLRMGSPVSNSANLMLDEPPLIVRMHVLSGATQPSLLAPQRVPWCHACPGTALKMASKSAAFKLAPPTRTPPTSGSFARSIKVEVVTSKFPFGLLAVLKGNAPKNDDRDWSARWVVVNTGAWLSERKVLIHSSAIVRAADRAKQP